MIRLVILLVMLQVTALLQAQDTLLHVQQQTLMFWNLENAFWPSNDSTRQDDEFTPDGIRHWNLSRLRQKLTQAERTLLAAGHGLPPMAVGLAEIEGDSVMHYWTHSTPLRQLGYRYLVTDQSDTRGIQTALLYLPSDFKLISHESFSIIMPDGRRSTRQLLHASGRLVNADTLDLIVCHLPSQYGGTRQSDPARQAAQHTLMHVADSIAFSRLHPRIVIMGDMNDAPSARRPWWDGAHTGQWHNLMLPLQKELRRHPASYGSHKYQGVWSFLDQFIVNTQLLPDTLGEEKPVRASQPSSFSLPFMLTSDDSHLGQRPRRSYYGATYEGGTSDHLPIVLNLDIMF